jgi:hypothetical protein
VGETDALMPPTHIGYSRYNVQQNEEEVLSATHDNPYYNTVMSYMKQTSQSSLGVECLRNPCILSMCYWYKGYNQETINY